MTAPRAEDFDLPDEIAAPPRLDFRLLLRDLAAEGVSLSPTKNVQQSDILDLFRRGAASPCSGESS